MERTGFIGGSDVAAIMGRSLWRTPYMMWLIKTGRESSNVDNAHTEWGKRLETSILHKWLDDHPEFSDSARRDMMFSKDFMRGTPDMVAGDLIVDAKNSTRVWYDVPDDYYWQMQFYLYLSDRERGQFAVLAGGNEYSEWDVLACPDDQYIMRMMVEEFWNLVISDTPPPRAAADEEGSIGVLDERGSSLLDEYARLTQESSALDDRIKSLRSEIVEMVGPGRKALGTNHKVSVFNVNRKRLDQTLVEQNLREGVTLLDCQKTTSYNSLRVTPNDKQ